MTQALELGDIDSLPRTPASDVKRLGWRGVMKSVGQSGKIVVTNHNQPEAVILSTEEYAAIVRALARNSDEAALEALRHRFDERLAALDAVGAADRLRTLARAPARLHGRVKAGRPD
ncbi:type II toxin-antitoxin system prevent-host-death family antitoxin [Pseudazoarcus pumilus]|uniref:Antitoxin n=1 Tax=Pseudazoarcus pumilus TaxID=2067960 RepID=A0A2I6S7S1_9RHOO|nr:type II toxin-antitoxin system prevent-host-death family antitoxin [Pseudazoarcus pumilus]AUN95288.1 prevent-host-death protein [Pseudazoarcus pumilus]